MIQIFNYQFNCGILVIIYLNNIIQLEQKDIELLQLGNCLIKSLINQYSHIRNADGAYLVYDVTSESSFNALEYWYDSIKKATGDDIVVYLVGNKYDLNERYVDYFL